MGIAAESVELPEAIANVRELAAWLEATRPGLRGVLASVRFAIGDEFAEPERALSTGDVVALLPPVSGG
jgi:molybdopterin converting factor small subunit